MYGVFPIAKTTHLVKWALLLAVPAALANDNPDPAAIERGPKAFIASCGFCHVETTPPVVARELIRSPLVNRDVSGNLIGPVIKNGRPEFYLELWAIRTLFKYDRTIFILFDR
jgi:hypothetical protein